MNKQVMTEFAVQWGACRSSINWLDSLPPDISVKEALDLCPYWPWMKWLYWRISVEYIFSRELIIKINAIVDETSQYSDYPSLKSQVSYYKKSLEIIIDDIWGNT